MKRAALLASAAIAFVCSGASSQNPATIQVGTAALYLGMPEPQVEAALSSTFTIQKRTSDNFSSWIITAPSINGQFSYIASLALRNGRLTSVRRSWGPSDQEAGIPLAKALYGAASQLVAEGRRHCLLDVGSRQDPRADMRTIFLICSGKRLEIAVTESNETGNAVNIDEVLDAKP